MPKHPEPVVTSVGGSWQGEWTNGYLIVLKTADTSRPGSFRAELDVYYQGTLLTTEGVDLLSPTSRQTFGVSLASRNGTAPLVWDDNLIHFYGNLQEAMAQAAVSPWAQAITAAEFVAQNEAEVEADVRDLLVLGCISIIAAPRALVPCDVDQHVFWI